jgi:hypothetical protein
MGKKLQKSEKIFPQKIIPPEKKTKKKILHTNRCISGIDLAIAQRYSVSAG